MTGVRTGGGLAAIFVVASRNSGPYECRIVTVEGNTTAGSGIHIAGSPAENNVVRNNRHIGPNGRIKNEADATCTNNASYGSWDRHPARQHLPRLSALAVGS